MGTQLFPVPVHPRNRSACPRAPIILQSRQHLTPPIPLIPALEPRVPLRPYPVEIQMEDVPLCDSALLCFSVRSACSVSSLPRGLPPTSLSRRLSFLRQRRPSPSPAKLRPSAIRSFRSKFPKNQTSSTLQFQIGGNTQLEGTLTVGSQATVDYHTAGGKMIATRVVITPASGVSLY
jgi:hypothetical protein